MFGPNLLSVYIPKRQAALHAGSETGLAAMMLGPRLGRRDLDGCGKSYGRVSWSSVGVLRWRIVGGAPPRSGFVPY
jgi:hypothetical protein